MLITESGKTIKLVISMVLPLTTVVYGAEEEKITYLPMLAISKKTTRIYLIHILIMQTGAMMESLFTNMLTKEIGLLQKKKKRSPLVQQVR